MNIGEKIISIIDPYIYEDRKKFEMWFNKKNEECKNLKQQNDRLFILVQAINEIINRNDQVLKIIDPDLIIYTDRNDIVIATSNQVKKCEYKCKILCYWNSNDRYIYIEDIYSEEINNGYGTLAMEALSNYAKKQKIETITGKLSSVDTEDTEDRAHRDRLLHYYTKNGFTITNSGLVKRL